MVNILCFGSLPDHLNTATGETAWPDSVNTVALFQGRLRERETNREQYLAEDKLWVTINREFAELESPVMIEDERAVISIGLHWPAEYRVLLS